MPFVPLASFPRVSPAEQVRRDVVAEQIVGDEFNQDMPDDSRAALEAEYRHRFGKTPPSVQRGFVPLADGGFTPVKDEPSLLRTIALENPATALGETALNLGSQMVALPVAGIAGLATEAGHALGLTEKTGADTVHAVGEALTYQPRGEFGKAATDLATKPFQLLAEAGQAAGGKVLDVTGSPLLATAVDTAINAAPMAIGPGIKGAKAIRERVNARSTAEQSMPREDGGFKPLTESVPEVPATTTVKALVDSPELTQKKAADAAFEALPKAATVDEAIALAQKATDTPIGPAVQHVVDVPVEIQPGRFSQHTDAMLAQFHEAVPEIRPQIEAEIHRRTLLADQMAAERQALPENPGVVPVDPAPALSIETSAVGNLVIRGDSAALDAVGQSIKRAALNRDIFLRRREPDGSVALVVAKDVSTKRPDLIQGAVDRINEQRGGATKAGVALDDQLKTRPDRPSGSGFTPLVAERRQAMPTGANGGAPLIHEQQSMASGNVQNGAWNPGAEYTPFVDQVRAPAANAKTATDLPDPIRREQIIKTLATDLGTTIYEGRIKGDKKLGFFRPKNEEVRIKNANDIEVVAHELAHMIDKRIPEIQKAYLNDKVLAGELRAVSYDKKNIKEGFAEAVRLWMTQSETLEAKAPKAHAWLEDFASGHQYGPALRKAQDQMTAWFGQDALNRARSKIGTDKPLAEFFDRFWDKFQQSTVNDLHGIYNMERSLKEGKIAPNGAYESARLSRASASITDGAVRFGYPVKRADGHFTYAGKGLEEILKPVAENIEDALLYFVGRSSHELMSQGREHLFTRGEIDAMLRLKTPERVKAFQDYQAWNKGILDFSEAQGVINPESRRLWQRTQYLPFHRVGQAGGVKGKPGNWSGVQALTGGTTNIKDVLGNMVGNAAMLIDKALKNEARLKVADLADKIEGAGKFMVKIDAESRPVKISGDQVLDEMFKRYGIAIDGDAPAFFEFLIKGQPPAGNNVVAVLRGGKPIWYEVGDPILYRALMAIDRQPMQWLVKLLSIPKRIGQTTITLTPDFMIANIARDTIMGSVMSRAGFRPIVDSLQGMRLRLTNDPIYKDYIANGGGLSSIYLDETALRTKLERFYGRQGIDYRTVLDTPSKMLHGLETIADAFEVSTRLGEYRRAIQRGENPRHAAYLGRDVSTDFAMRGDSKALGALYDTVMFLRPAVVSLDRLIRGVAHDPNKGAIAAKAGMVAMASAALYLMNKDEPRYADLPDWDRDANWHIFVGEHHFRYPKIWEIGALASTAERTVEKILAEDPAGLGKDFARILAATFNWNLTPQIAAPLIEQATNRNSFTKAPLETPGMENVQPFLRAKPGTSETMKAAGMLTRNLPEGAQINPVRAEALLRGYFNTYAMYGLMLTDKAFFGDKLPEKRTDELPVVRRFYANEPAKHTKYESEFYDMLQEAKRLRGTMKELDDMGLREMADDKEKSPLATEAKPLERAAKSLSGINKDMEAVRNDSSLTPAEKRAKLDALTVERNSLLKAAVTDAKTAQKEKRP